MFESPWIDFEKRSAKKQSRYLAMDSDGTAQFQVSLYVDRIYDDVPKLDTDLRMIPLSLMTTSPIQPHLRSWRNSLRVVGLVGAEVPNPTVVGEGHPVLGSLASH
jgi:hypothetical protein